MVHCHQEAALRHLLQLCLSLDRRKDSLDLEALSNPSFSGSVKVSWHVATFVAFILKERELNIVAGGNSAS